MYSHLIYSLGWHIHGLLLIQLSGEGEKSVWSLVFPPKSVSRIIISGTWSETLWNPLSVKPKKLPCKHKVVNALSQSVQALSC